MGMRDTINGALEVTRLAFDAAAAVASVVVAIPIAFAIGEATTMARAVRGDITPAAADRSADGSTRLHSASDIAPAPLVLRGDAYRENRPARVLSVRRDS
ncbi:MULTISPECIES: hypothetical protein [unclassified Rhodococcus (in: high G+C Gram-positive bacteria)]|jgi:hypothetical protein|uniref:hypothetical protein n=1 Tax=unclassified Rhodococcus (in: high G+C Gram-positive bacteria) TaxID=192944 RepID=UPI00131FDC65|nr:MULTISPECIES: hypothetical protein [unclassified Rhodococcus (in: high G+C Gram-positive bacteria)]QHE70074.1 hypothetical protein GFS60_03653 [Rhodococcus sp. WAY2]